MERFNVTGMSCAACSARVEKVVSALPGVEEVSVNLLTNSMGVEFSAPATAEAICQAVTRAGYGASPVTGERQVRFRSLFDLLGHVDPCGLQLFHQRQISVLMKIVIDASGGDGTDVRHGGHLLLGGGGQGVEGPEVVHQRLGGGPAHVGDTQAGEEPGGRVLLGLLNDGQELVRVLLLADHALFDELVPVLPQSEDIRQVL